MLPKLLSLALLAMACTIRFSNATECFFSTYTQQYELEELQQSETTIETVAIETQKQMHGALKQYLGVTLVQTNYTVSRTEKLCTIVYDVIYNCDGPVTTVLTTGETITIKPNLKYDKVRVDQVIRAGLIDCRNLIALRAHERRAGIKGISCHYHFGCDNAFVWEIETTPTVMQQAVSYGSFKKEALLYSALETAFSKKIFSTYKQQVTSVKFLGRENYANGRCGLKFQLLCSKSIVEVERRTKFVENIQLAYYEILQSYFGSVCKGVKVPRTCEIRGHRSIAVTTTNIIWDHSRKGPIRIGGKYQSQPKRRYQSVYSYDSHKGYSGKQRHHPKKRYQSSESSESLGRYLGKGYYGSYWRYPGKQRRHSKKRYQSSESSESLERYLDKGYYGSYWRYPSRGYYGSWEGFPDKKRGQRGKPEEEDEEGQPRQGGKQAQRGKSGQPAKPAQPAVRTRQ